MKIRVQFYVQFFKAEHIRLIWIWIHFSLKKRCNVIQSSISSLHLRVTSHLFKAIAFREHGYNLFWVPSARPDKTPLFNQVMITLFYQLLLVKTKLSHVVNELMTSLKDLLDHWINSIRFSVYVINYLFFKLFPILIPV